MRLRDRLASSSDTVGFFYYAGHGVQSDGTNYLIPVGESIPSEDFLRSRSLSAQIVLDSMQRAGNGLTVVVLDACRDNPFSASSGRPRTSSGFTSALGTNGLPHQYYRYLSPRDGDGGFGSRFTKGEIPWCGSCPTSERPGNLRLARSGWLPDQRVYLSHTGMIELQLNT